MKCEANWALSSLKVLMEFGVSLLNHILVEPFSVMGKALHMILSSTLWHMKLWWKGEGVDGRSEQ